MLPPPINVSTGAIQVFIVPLVLLTVYTIIIGIGGVVVLCVRLLALAVAVAPMVWRLLPHPLLTVVLMGVVHLFIAQPILLMVHTIIIGTGPVVAAALSVKLLE